MNRLPSYANPRNDGQASSREVAVVAVLLAAAMLGVYHNPERVGMEIYEYSNTLEQLDAQSDTDNQVAIGTSQKRYGFAALAAIGFYLAFVRRSPRTWQPNGLVWLIAGCLGWTAATCLWTFESAVTLRELVRLAVAAMVAYGIARNYTPREGATIILVVMSASVALAIGSELSMGLLTPWQGDYRLQGGMHANMLAVHAGFMALAAQVLRGTSDRKMLYGVLVAIGVAALLLTKSRTGLAAYGLGAIILWMIQLEPRRAAGYWALGSAALACAFFALAIGGPSLQRSLTTASKLGRNVESGSLTGRLPLWSAVAGDISRRPLLGYGYEAFWTAERREQIANDVQWYPTDAHSIYFNTLLEKGLIGASLDLALVLTAGWVLLKIYRSTHDQSYALYLALIGYLLFHGLAEAGCSAARMEGTAIGVGLFLAAGWRGSQEASVPSRSAAPPIRTTEIKWRNAFVTPSQASP